MAKRFAVIVYPLLLVLVFRCSSFSGRNLYEFITWMGEEVAAHPFDFTWTKHTLPVLLVFTLFYVAIWMLIISSMKNVMPGIEHGSAEWTDPKTVTKEYGAKGNSKDLPKQQRDVILTRNARVCLDKLQHNVNTLVHGGSGTMKTRGYILPNLLQLNCNPVITDPKGEILRKTGHFLKKMGYDIRVLDLNHPYKSHGYNPFAYIRDDGDILKFVNMFWETTRDKRASQSDQIWDDQAKAMLISFIMYLHHFGRPEDLNFETVWYLFQNMDASEQKEGLDPIDKMFHQHPEDPAFGYYNTWNAAKGKTLSSIRSTFSARLSMFSLDTLQSLTRTDEMNILDLTDKKVAIFMILPDNGDTSYNFLAGTLYAHIFQLLYDYADNVHHGPLPRPVRFFMDEFANICLPDNFQNILSTARSRNISFIIVIQDLQQLEALYKDYFKVLKANCPWRLFLGSTEKDSLQEWSDMLGKQTVIVRSRTRNYGKQGGSSIQENAVERPLLFPDEVKRYARRWRCILITPDGHNIKDLKYNLKKHPFYKEVSEKKFFFSRKVPLYLWGEADLSIGNMRLIDSHYGGKIASLPQTDYVLLDPEEETA